MMMKCIFLVATALSLTLAMPGNLIDAIGRLFQGDVPDVGEWLDAIGLVQVALSDLDEKAQEILTSEFSEDELNSGSGFILRVLTDLCFDGNCTDDEKESCVYGVAHSYKETRDPNDPVDNSALFKAVFEGLGDNIGCIDMSIASVIPGL